MLFLQSETGVIHYRTVGDLKSRPVIALINSLGTDFRIWDDVIDFLGKDYALLLHDKRGHGLSDLQPETYKIEDHASDLTMLIDHLQIEKVIVWGLSIGGLIAQAFYAYDPSRVSALILSNTAHKIGSHALWNDRIQQIEEQGLAHIADATMERWFSTSYRNRHTSFLAAARTMLIRQSTEGYNRTCATIRDADLTKTATHITAPVLCIAGDDDGSTPSRLVYDFSKLIANSQFVEIPDCGHLPCLEQPEIYARVAQDFLSRHGVT